MFGVARLTSQPAERINQLTNLPSYFARDVDRPFAHSFVRSSKQASKNEPTSDGLSITIARRFRSCHHQPLSHPRCMFGSTGRLRTPRGLFTSHRPRDRFIETSHYRGGRGEGERTRPTVPRIFPINFRHCDAATRVTVSQFPARGPLFPPHR